MRIYGLSKARALTAGVTFSLICVLLWLIHAESCIIDFLPFLAWTWLSFYKHWKRDQDILKVKVREEAHLWRAEPPRAIMPPPASRGSNGSLFVPDPDSRDPYL